MANVVEIKELSAPELDVFARLTETQLRSKKEPEKGIFIAEGHKVIAHAMDAGCEPLAFLVERKHITGKAKGILARFPEVPVYTGDSSLLEGLTGYALTRGVLCAMRRPKLPTVEALCEKASRLAVLEGIVDPTNVGAIFRNAAALGFDGVLLDPTCCDPLNRRSVRVSMGTVFQVPWARMEEGWLDWLKSLGFAAVAMALDENSVSVEDRKLTQEPKLAVVLGTEGDGLRPETVAACDYTVMIPMAHGVDSLNVAAASAIAFWQLRNR